MIEQTKDFAYRDAKGEEIVRAVDCKILDNYYTLGPVRFCYHCLRPIKGSNSKALS
ncbi:MAG TPA: hypothetical protein VN414_02040 [Methanosarcina sp.]|nr:hypothetical protein [Methanosarcina sp.]